MRLSDHFTLAELTHSETAVRLGLDNSPPPEVLKNLKHVAAQMEKVRALLGLPISVSSGYRSPKVNAAVKGAKTSAHVTGHAIDFNCYGFGTPLAIAKAIHASAIEYDQLIHEYGRWVHLSFDPMGRRDELTIDRLGTRHGLLKVR